MQRDFKEMSHKRDQSLKEGHQANVEMPTSKPGKSRKNHGYLRTLPPQLAGTLSHHTALRLWQSDNPALTLTSKMYSA